MSFEFEQENIDKNKFNNMKSSSSGMVGFLIKNGIVKDATSANMILIVGAFVCILLSIYFFVFGFDLPQSSQPAPVPTRIPGPPSELEL